MLSTQEIEKIKEGVATIRQQLPDAGLPAIIRMFNFVFGNQLSYPERTEAEEIIRTEWDQWLT